MSIGSTPTPSALKLPASLSWSYSGARDAFRRHLPLYGMMVAAVLIAGIASGSGWGAALGFIVMGAVSWRYWLPQRFELNSKGLQYQALRRGRQIAWRSIHRYEICDDGLRLFPTTEITPVDLFRTLYLPYGPHRDEILRFFEHYLGPGASRGTVVVADRSGSARSAGGSRRDII
jgi:hypothetical protein